MYPPDVPDDRPHHLNGQRLKELLFDIHEPNEKGATECVCKFVRAYACLLVNVDT